MKFHCRIHYFDVIAGFLGLAVALVCLLIATRETWLWNYKDSLGLSLFLLAVPAFILFRQRMYAQKIPWLLFCFSALAITIMVVLLRRWSFMWVGVGCTILLLGLVMRSKTLLAHISWKGVFASTLLMAGTIIFALTLVEGALRLIPGLLPEGARLRIHYRDEGKPWYVRHPYIGHLHLADANANAGMARPGTKTASADPWGFRNAWPWPEQAEIVAVGDSVTVSQTVDDDQAWTAILDRALPHSRVLNLGLVGSGPQQYLRIYETFGVDMAPKVLLVGLFLGNDLWDANRFDLWWASGGKGSDVGFGRQEASTVVRGWIKKTYLFALLEDLRDSYQSGRFLKGRTMRLADGHRVQLVPSEPSKWARHGRPGKRAFTLVLEALEGIQALAEHNQTHPVVLFFPMKEEVYLPLLGHEAPDLAAPFVSELRKRGITYLDLGPFFRQRASAGEALFWEIDGHPNPRGYALIAEAVLSHLKANAKRYGLKDWGRILDGSSGL